LAFPINIAPLETAIERLRDDLVRLHSDPTDEQRRDSLIQRFKLTYELCHRTLRRYVRQTAAVPEDVDQMDFQDLIRIANQQGLLLGDWLAWHRYRDSRAKASHATNAKIAEEVAQSLSGFVAEAEYLRDELRKRLA